MGRELWRLVEAHQESTPYGVSVRAIARAAGVGHSTLAKWEQMRRLPAPDHLRAVARQINVPYRVALEAALTDAGYLPESEDAPRKPARRATARGIRVAPSETTPHRDAEFGGQ